YALEELQKDESVYNNGEWQVSDNELVPILNDRYNIKIARRTVAKYKSKLNIKTIPF
ncbi:MAG: hypothetical protein Q8Q35_01680, partial [Nanoarchaeota archaeon]|nr:hypothetical protein [Nanoarchaeota archaeon]